MAGKLRLAGWSREYIAICDRTAVKQGMAVRCVKAKAKAVVVIGKHNLRWCQSTVTTSRARARDVQTHELTRDEPLTSAKTFT